MGLLKFRGFSSIPTLFKKIQSRREQKERFSPTNAEWASKNQVQRILDTSRTTAGGTIIFTVPSGTVLFITSAWFTSQTTGTDIFQIADLQITSAARTSERAIFVIRHRTDGLILPVVPLASAFPSPLKVLAGKNIEIVNQGANITTSGGFTGWTEPESVEIV